MSGGHQFEWHVATLDGERFIYHIKIPESRVERDARSYRLSACRARRRHTKNPPRLPKARNSSGYAGVRGARRAHSKCIKRPRPPPPTNIPSSRGRRWKAEEAQTNFLTLELLSAASRLWRISGKEGRMREARRREGGRRLHEHYTLI